MDVRQSFLPFYSEAVVCSSVSKNGTTTFRYSFKATKAMDRAQLSRIYFLGKLTWKRVSKECETHAVFRIGPLPGAQLTIVSTNLSSVILQYL
jgi:hypothetical protein